MHSQNIAGWALMLLGVGLISMINENTSLGAVIPYEIILSVGGGLLYATTFSVLAPLEPTQNAAALSFLLFIRTITSVCSLLTSSLL